MSFFINHELHYYGICSNWGKVDDRYIKSQISCHKGKPAFVFSGKRCFLFYTKR